jgi:two-component system LytT family response regulator
MRYRVLIVDDEPLACERLRGWLREEESVEIVGECGCGEKALAMLRDTPVDLVFLDMEMPGGDGMEVLAQMPDENRPVVIFSTAHERFAVEAFAVQAVDYLLKPFDRERLSTALRRAKDRIDARRAGKLVERLDSLISSAASPEKKPGYFAIKADGRLVFLKPDDVVWIEAANNCVVLHLNEGRLPSRFLGPTMQRRLCPGSEAVIAPPVVSQARPHRNRSAHWQ